MFAAAGSNWAQLATAWATIFIAFGVLVAGIQLRDARRTRNAEIAKSLAQRWDGSDLIESRKLILSLVAGLEPPEAAKKLVKAVRRAKESKGEDRYYLYTRYLNFFEELGVSFPRRSSGLRMVETLLGTTIRDGWRTWKLVIREVWGEQSTVAENFGRLATKLERRYRRRKRRERFQNAMLRPFRWALRHLGEWLLRRSGPNPSTPSGGPAASGP